MKTISSKIMALLLPILFLLGFSLPLFADESPKIETVLTDQVSADDTPGAPKDVFPTDQAKIYLAWKSSDLKSGQKIKSVWIAVDTKGVVPANYKIDEATYELNKDFKSKMLASLPGGFWGGKFALSKPTAGWPVGQYRVDLYVDDTLVKSLKYSVASDAAATESPAAAAAPDSASAATKVGVIAADNSAEDGSPYWGTGNGANEDEASKMALKNCVDAGGKACKVVVKYEKCGAYAVSGKVYGYGYGDTKKIAEDNAISYCKANDCKIIISDCNE